jgi:CDP-diacylglycerol--glycerol-3-phosphate 3-phosphatidyltransferase
MLANWITLSRLPLLVVVLWILFHGSPSVRLFGAALLFISLLLDTVDGLVARKRGETSLFGSVLDIALDRAYELSLWVAFAALGMIPFTIPLVVIARTTLTDAFRSIGVAKGIAPFDQHTSSLSKFLVGSPVMRSGYSITKVVTFVGLALAQAFGGFPAGELPGSLAEPMFGWLLVTAWIALGFCVFRGLPVIIGTLKRQWGTIDD